MKNKISIIGAGNLGKSIAEGFLKGGIIAQDLCLTRRNISKLNYLKEKGVHISSNNKESVKDADIVILAVKPFNVVKIINEIKPFLKEKSILISLATGITLQDISLALNEPKTIFRAMPNTATAVLESTTFISTENASSDEIKLVNHLFSLLGEVFNLEENLFEAGTALSASGIAFVFRFIRAMVQGGVEIGFKPDLAQAIVNQTVKGAAELLITSGRHPEQEIDRVTTPSGCTISGLNEMENKGLSSSVIAGLTATYRKIND